jgi:uncharacterized protein (PEP-CTERM system associated)
VESRDRPRTHFGRVVGSLDYLVDPTLVVALRAGTDVQDVSTGQSQTSTSWGAGVNWRPGPRTSLAIDYDRRYFGNSHALVFTHRMARTVWTASDTRSVQIGGNRSRAEISTYDLFYAQFASVEPDPVRRDALVRAFLDANGLDAESTCGSDHVRSLLRADQQALPAQPGPRASSSAASSTAAPRPTSSTACRATRASSSSPARSAPARPPCCAR